ncbi:DNA topoisomerase 2-binding protein 1-A-like [Mercenaria mercenaria]|uniref:DNA topoisomerase 2-binding protein 1-A-like n=1 Tax=Mercenaria mercenaria TaxID=6596 RepID=UPI00234F3584|nr:DNA topoisomerase 2-binding protein 1-A-like [Mercenaria mercenaria]
MGDFKVRCVKVFGHQDTQKLIEEAFQCLKDQKLSPVWFSEDECFTVKEKKKTEVYIFDVFAGDAFEHISGLGSRILGPMCVITSLACKKDIPRRTKPIYNLAMKDITVCCTNIDKEIRDGLHGKVEFMGGNVTRDLTDEVTHLVAGTVGSPKYHVAGSHNKQIMLPKWVDEVWKKSKLEAVHGSDEQFQDYKCPIFKGQVITVSGLSSSERTEAKKLIEKEGGVYSGEMKAKECTHLITNDPKGQKYNFALKWEIHVVRSEWLYESIEKGYCQDEKNYPVDNSDNDRRHMKTSTPERRSVLGMSVLKYSNFRLMVVASDMTDINNISMISMAQVNETACTTFTRLEDPTLNLDVTRAPEDLFLDGCKIYLSGFRGATLEKLRKIINSGGGTRFNQITDNLTHVVIGERISNDIDMVKSLTNRPHTVTSQWLVECFKQEKLLDETPYYSPEIAQPTPKTPEIKGVRKKSRVPQEEMKQNTSKGDNKEEEDMHDIMSQYLDNQQPDPPDVTRSNETTIAPQERDDDLTQDPNSTAVSEGGIFLGKSFVFYGFNEDSIPVLSSFIKENGGTVLQSNARRIPDYAIVPIDGFPVDRTVKDIVTNAWLQMCIEQNVLLDVHKNPLFAPIELNVETLPLKDCVLSVSGYLGTERDCLVSIADVLGAKTQDYFVRQAKNDLLPSTHLVVNAPEGSKYQAAKKWGIPAVSKLWILACAKSGRKEKEEIFLIDNLADDNVNISSLTVKPSTDKNINQSLQKDNQSRKSLKENQSESSKSRRSGNLNENGANINDNDKKIAQTKFDEAENDLNSQTKRQNAGIETSQRDFSTMGDTEAILAGLNTQGELDTVCDKSKTLNIQPDVTVSTENNVSDRGENITIHTEKNVLTTEREVLEIEKEDNIIDEHEDQDAASDHDDDDDDDDEVVFVNKNLESAKNETKKAETPPLTRFKRKLEKNPARIGTPALTKESARDKLLGGVKLNTEYNVSMDTPPLTRFMRKLEKEPAKLGTPSLAEMNAREKLMGKGYQSVRTIERKKKQDEQSQSQKENMETPVQSRVKELQSKAGVSVDKDTPSKFLNPNVRYLPKFDTEELLKSFETPEAERAARGRKRKDSLDDDELHELAVSKATKKLADLREARLQGNFPASQAATDDPSEMHELNEEPSTVLRGVVIIVGKRLTKDQAELHDLVELLGGDYRWNYDKSCTHFIFQGRQNDTVKEFKHAKTIGMKIVSPHWLYMCREQNAKVDESLFPHTFNPNLSLSVVSTRRTPLRTPRSTRRLARPGSKAENPPPPAMQPIVIPGEDEDVGNKGSKEDQLIHQSKSQKKITEVCFRLEQAKLAHKLERANSPTQEVGGMYDLNAEDAQYSESEGEMEVPIPPFGEQQQVQEKTTPKPSGSSNNKTPTPEGPSITFPTSNKSGKVTPPKPVEVEHEQQQPEAVQKSPPVFIMSGMSVPERDDYGALVEQLGGTVLDTQMYDDKCTHLVINKVTRNEKFLASLASGKWVLHKSYFEACRQEQRFVEEDFYEWGSEGTLSLVKNMESNVRLLAAAARDWRMKIQEEKLKSPTSYGAFCSWRVLLNCDKSRESNYRRLLVAGGATVMNMKPPYSGRIDATHALLELHKVPLQQEDIEKLISSDCLCLKPEYISGFLCNPNVDVTDYTPPEISALQTVMVEESENTGKKRKASSSNISLKRSKRK